MNTVTTGTSQRPLDVISPKIADLLFWEHVPAATMAADRSLAIGSAHPKPSQFPNHKVSAIKADASAPGMVRLYYLAERSNQQDYNWELEDDTSSQWPRLVQTWVILRSNFTTLSMSVTAPSAYGQTWTRIGERERRTGDEITDGLFVILQVIYEDISNAIISRQIDPDSGRAVSIELRKVPSGTAAQQVNALGYIREVEAINTRWALETKRPVSGLVGVGVRNYPIHRPWPLPPVLLAFATKTNVDGTFGYDYAMKAWDDECLIDVEEYWSQSAPSLSPPAVLGKTGIRWNGAYLNINIEPCLHPLVYISETSGSSTRWRTYGATLYTDWPATLTYYPSVRPHPKGGFLIVKWTIHTPVGIVS